MHLPLYCLQALLIATRSGATEKSLAAWPLQMSFSSYWRHRLNSLNLFSLDRDPNHLPKSPMDLSSFKTTLLVFPWSGNDPKHNTVVQVTLIWRGVPASFGHTTPAGADSTLPGHWRWWAMHSCAACAGPQQKASACQKAIWFMLVSKWLIICGKFCFFPLFALLKHVITARYLAGISYRLCQMPA